MPLFYCYEDCFHGSQYFEEGNWYNFPTERYLPKKKDGKTIAHFEPPIAAETHEERERKALDSPGILRLKSILRELKKTPAKEMTPMISAEIRRMEKKIAQIKGEEPIAYEAIRPVMVPQIVEEEEEERERQRIEAATQKVEAVPEVNVIETPQVEISKDPAENVVAVAPKPKKKPGRPKKTTASKK